MARDLDHLQLVPWQDTLPRRRQSGGGGFQRNAEERPTHGAQLVDQAQTVADRLQQRPETVPPGINPKLIFKINLHPKGSISDEDVDALGLRILAKSPEKTIVVFPDEPTLAELRRRLSEYAGLVQDGHKYAYLDAINTISELSKEDRTGQRLLHQPLSPDEIAFLDIELWHAGSRAQCQQMISELQQFLDSRNLRVTDSWIGDSLCLVRAKVDASALDDLLDVDYIKEIDRRAEPSFEVLDVYRVGLSDVSVSSDVPQDLVGILIIDSGVMQGHPLIGPALGDAQVFPDSLRARVVGGPEDGDNAQGGHGTAVAGIAIYNDIGQCIEERLFVPSARLFSARVTDDNNCYDEEELLEHQLDEAVSYFVEEYPQVKVINISLGNGDSVTTDTQYQFRFAAAVDDIAYRYRDRPLVFVVSAGNYWPDLSDEDQMAAYPEYLLSSNDSRVIDPATSAIAVTVGGLSYGTGRPVQLHLEHDTDCAVAGESGWPSPFTRTGWGFGGAIKPEVVDFAGDQRFSRGRIHAGSNSYTGLPTTSKSFAPPDGNLFRTVAGTSFAAPRVANLAAILFREFPDASSNLVRALIADSSRIPASRPAFFQRARPWDENILRTYGYGQPSFERARWSDKDSVLLLTEGEIELDKFQLYLLPSLPPDFLSAKGSGYISVTLAYDPPTRHTRTDYYLGVTMSFDVFRNTSPDAVRDAIKVWSEEERGDIAAKDLPRKGTLSGLAGMPTDVDLQPGVQRRSKGTLQKGLCKISGRSWQYDGGQMVLAIICQRNRWVPADITHQRFAVIVSLHHDNSDVDIYAHVRQQARVYQRVRLQA